jgi:DNA primase
MEREQVDPFGAVEILSNQYNIPLEESAEYKAQKELSSKKKERGVKAKAKVNDVMEYLKRRKLNDSTIAEFELGSSKGDVYIPIHGRHGEVVAGAVRRLDPNANPKYINDSTDVIYQKGGILYNHHRARKAFKGTLYITEGYMDVMTISQELDKAVVGYCGSSITGQQAQLLTEFHQRKYTIILVPDNDKTGIEKCEVNIQTLRNICRGYILKVPAYGRWGPGTRKARKARAEARTRYSIISTPRRRTPLWISLGAERPRRKA